MKDDQQRAGYEMEANRLTREKLEAEAARDHLRARLRELEPYAQHVNPCNAGSCRHCGWSESVHPLRPSTSAGAACETFSSEPCTCGLSDLLAILSEPEEAQQTEKEPDHARVDTTGNSTDSLTASKNVTAPATILAELAQVRQERDEIAEELASNRACNLFTWKERATKAEAARDRLRVRLQHTMEQFHTDEGEGLGGARLYRCRVCGKGWSVGKSSFSRGPQHHLPCPVADLLAILSELEEAQQTDQQEPDHAR